ncbi:hypothetical protein EK904_004221, partial [Melospiza melodia maxima]
MGEDHVKGWILYFDLKKLGFPEELISLRMETHCGSMAAFLSGHSCPCSPSDGAELRCASPAQSPRISRPCAPSAPRCRSLPGKITHPPQGCTENSLKFSFWLMPPGSDKPGSFYGLKSVENAGIVWWVPGDKVRDLATRDQGQDNVSNVAFQIWLKALPLLPTIALVLVSLYQGHVPLRASVAASVPQPPRSPDGHRSILKTKSDFEELFDNIKIIKNVYWDHNYDAKPRLAVKAGKSSNFLVMQHERCKAVVAVVFNATNIQRGASRLRTRPWLMRTTSPCSRDHLNVLFTYHSHEQKERVPESNLLLGRGWAGSPGHTGNSSIHLESTCRGSRGELLALPHSVLLQMCKTSSRKLGSGSQDLPSLERLLQGS